MAAAGGSSARAGAAKVVAASAAEPFSRSRRETVCFDFLVMACSFSHYSPRLGLSRSFPRKRESRKLASSVLGPRLRGDERWPNGDDSHAEQPRVARLDRLGLLLDRS